MLLLRDIVVVIFLFGGFFFLTVGIIGLIRLPDIYNRLHALGKCDTLGIGLIILAMLLIYPGVTNTAKLLLMGGLTFVINPVMTHLITKTAYLRGASMFEGTFYESTYHDEEEEGELITGEDE